MRDKRFWTAVLIVSAVALLSASALQSTSFGAGRARG